MGILLLILVWSQFHHPKGFSIYKTDKPENLKIKNTPEDDLITGTWYTIHCIDYGAKTENWSLSWLIASFCV